MPIALSTMWAQQDRFRDHMDEFARIAASAGYTAIEASHSTDIDGLEALITRGSLPLQSLHAPTPLEKGESGRWNVDLNLASLDEEERQAAVKHSLRTIDYARHVGAKTVVVHLGECGLGLLEPERLLRAHYQAGGRAGTAIERLRVEAITARVTLATAYLPQAARSLSDLAEHASLAGVALGLETRLAYHEIPQIAELAVLMAPYPAALVGYWHDVGHAEVQHRLGLVDRNSWLATHGTRTIGAHLHDVIGITDHRAPGQGDVRWDPIAAGLPSSALRTFEINQHVPELLLGPALRYLFDRGVVASDVPQRKG